VETQAAKPPVRKEVKVTSNGDVGSILLLVRHWLFVAEREG
jgi:hypothetical protein